jgi:two-component system, NarL family, nitrate/nitrite response regulator NarL
MQILALAVAGKTNREIAKRIAISEQTVKHHLTNIFDKVGVYNRLELALFAIHHGLTSTKK